MTLDDYQHIVDEVQTILMSQGDPEEGVVVDLHHRFCSAVLEVNQRLRQCEGLLREGQRAEAIRECEDDPNLLDAVAVLDFPEESLWSDYAQQFDLQAAPQLLHDIAGDLNDAYSTEQSMEKILNQYRAHALARSPLETRIGVLRKIAQRDPDNPIWDADLRTFEKTRHNELQTELKVAIQSKNTSALAELERELRDSPWREPPAKQVLDRAQDAHTRIRAEQAREELARLQPDLIASFSELDVEAGRRLRSRWNGLYALAQPDLDDPLLEMVEPALQWLRDEDRRAEEEADYEANVNQLEMAIDRGADRLKLERLERAVTRDDRELPERLRRRYEERLRHIELAAARKRRMIAGSIITLVLIVGGITAFFVHRKVVDNRIRATEADLARLIDAGELDDAKSRLDDLEKNDAGVFQAEPVQQQRERLNAALSADSDRRQRRSGLIDSATEAGLTERKWDASLKQLEQAEKLSRTESELVEVRKLRRNVLQEQIAWQKSVDDSHTKAVSDLVTRAKSLKSDELEIELATINSLLKQVQRLAASKSVSPQIRQTDGLDVLKTKLEGRRDVLITRRKLNSELLNITKQVGNHAGYASALADFRKQHPLSRRSRDFELVLKHERQWSAIDRWNAFASTWAGEDFTKLSPVEARQRQDQAAKLKKAVGKLECVTRTDPYCGYLKSIEARAGKNGTSLAKQLRTNLAGGQMQLLMLETKDGTRYYFNAASKPKLIAGGKWKVEYFTDLGLTNRNTVAGGIKTTSIVNKKAGTGFDWGSTQQVFAKQVGTELDNLAKQGWETTFVNILSQLHTAKIDPILKLQLYGYLIDTASKGSTVLRVALEPTRKIMKASRVDTTANWIDPTNGSADRPRKEATMLLGMLKPPGSYTAIIKASLKKLARVNVEPRYRWIGWMHRKLEGTDWQCSIPSARTKSVAGTFALFILIRDINGVVSPKAIGQIERGVVRLNSKSMLFWREGEPVYLSSRPLDAAGKSP